MDEQHGCLNLGVRTCATKESSDGFGLSNSGTDKTCHLRITNGLTVPLLLFADVLCKEAAQPVVTVSADERPVREMTASSSIRSFVASATN